MTLLTPDTPNRENFEFCLATLKNLGYRGDLLNSKKTYQYLRSLMVDMECQQPRKGYDKLWQIMQPATQQSKYLILLRWQLSMIVATIAYNSDIKKDCRFPSCEM